MFIYECICLCGATLYVFKNTCYLQSHYIEVAQGGVSIRAIQN